MLTALKEVFRPTWKKLAWTVGLGLPVTLLGLYVASLGAVHSVQLIIIGGLCLLPNVLLWWLAETRFHIIVGTPLKLAILPLLQFLYFYVPVCFASLIIRRIRGRATQRQKPLG